MRSFLKALKQAGVSFSEDNIFKLSASLAYYTVFSMGPLMLVVISIAGMFFEADDVVWKLYWQMKDIIGQNAADQIVDIIRNLQDKNAGSFSIIGLVILVFGATTVFADIQDSINYIWSIKAKPKRGWLKFLKNRLLSFSMVIGLSFLLIVSLFVNSLADILLNSLYKNQPDTLVDIFQLINSGVVYLIITLLFACIYKFLPDGHIQWKYVIAGALFTGVLFMIGKLLISLYISSSEMSNTYGAAASIIILLSWIYYTAIILYFGAEFIKSFAAAKGQRIMPNENAVIIIKKEDKVID